MSAEPSPSRITLKDVARYPLPGFTAPSSFAFSPDDRYLAYLFSPERTLRKQLYIFDVSTGTRRPVTAPESGGTTEENISIEEALRRERQRELGLGVTKYEWAERANCILLPFPAGLYLLDEPGSSLRQVLEVAGQPALDPHFSPDGAWIAYVQDAELYVLPADGGEPRQLTTGARGTGRTNGLAEFVAQEEMGRSRGYWWSPDSRLLAFEEVDKTHIPVYRILHQGKKVTGESAQEDHRYPFAGKENARVRLGVVPAEGGDPVWMDLGDFEYLARADWMPDGRLTAQLMNRAQTRLELVTFDLQTGERSLILVEESDVWINLHDMFRPLKAPDYDGAFIWASERSGYRHLYLHNRDGGLLRTLTSGDWLVDRLAGVDERNGVVYFTGSRQSPLENHLYAVSLSGSEPQRLTTEPGTHTVCLDHAGTNFVDLHDGLDQPPQAALRSLQDGNKLYDIYENDDPRLEALNLQPPQIVSFENREGTRLYGALHWPPDGPRVNLPLIVSVYGGPHAQLVKDAWSRTASMRAQYLSSLGYLVFVLDNRGSDRRGLGFEGTIKEKMGQREVEDQVDGVRWLVAQGFADPGRVGITGWSYGGYMSLMCLLHASETFRVAVAGAPVTDWDGYDTCYTERYMGTPESNPDGYRLGSALQAAENLVGRLLLVHGLIDENVHFRHTARLINALIAARKSYDLLLFPDERHTPRKLKDRIFMEEQIRDYFRKHL